jgi:uncharacterized membrane protein (UPF0127 family)
MRSILSIFMLALCLLALYACGSTAPPTPAGTGSPLAEQPYQPSSPVIANQAPAGTPTWVPPTALAGTPIPGAEATLTAAPQLKKGTMSFTTARGETVNMTVEIADDEPSRELGLMFRASLPENGGMLFDFGGDTNSTFWMANTILPLSIAFIAADGTVLDVQDMKALDQTNIIPPGPYRYALEANQGFFVARGIAPGDKATLPNAQSVVIPGVPELCMK